MLTMRNVIRKESRLDLNIMILSLEKNRLDLILFLFLVLIHITFHCLATDANSELNPLTLKPINFAHEVSKSIDQIDSQLKNSDKCVDFISSKLDRVDRLQSDSFFPQTRTEIAELEDKGLETLNKLFQIQLRIRKKQQELAKRERLSFECLQNIRRSTRYIRFMEDMLIEWLIERKKITTFSSDVLGGKFPQVMVAPNYSQVNFKIGDLFLVRGKSYVSGMIARIGDTELQFSHLAILGLNEKNEKVIVEALIPYGTRITPFEFWMKQKEARVVLFRYQNADVALKAGKAAFVLANNFINKMGHSIPYDFHMSSLDADSIFCAELIENSFLTGSNFKVLLPEYKTLTTKFKSTSFLKNMGIEANEIFAPGDIEFDSRFDLIAEYRFLGKSDIQDSIPLLRQIRMQDAIIQSLYNWMVSDNYQFVDSWKINAKTMIAKALRYFGFFKDHFPVHMPMTSLKTVMQFEETSLLLEAHLFPLEESFYHEKKHSLHFQEMLKILKDFRNNQCRQSNSKLNQLITGECSI